MSNKKFTAKFKIPYPPTVNHYWGQKGNYRFLTTKARIFRNEVRRIVEQLKLNNNVDVPLSVKCVLFPPDRRKRDADNILKPVLDALEHADLYTNDVVVKSPNPMMGPFIGKHDSCALLIIEELEESWNDKLVQVLKEYDK